MTRGGTSRAAAPSAPDPPQDRRRPRLRVGRGRLRADHGRLAPTRSHRSSRNSASADPPRCSLTPESRAITLRRAPRMPCGGVRMGRWDPCAIDNGTGPSATLPVRCTVHRGSTPCVARPSSSSSLGSHSRPRSAHPRPPVRAAVGVNLDQWASSDRAWQNGNLNGNNSRYPEGGIVPFRLAVEGLKAGAHSIHINYDFTAGGHKAYDFLATWNVTNAAGKICAASGGAISSMCPIDAVVSQPRVPVGPLQGQRPVGQRRREVFGRAAPTDDLGRHDHVDRGADPCRLRERQQHRRLPGAIHVDRQRGPARLGRAPGPVGVLGQGRRRPTRRGRARSPARRGTCGRSSSTALETRTRTAASSRARSSANCRRWPSRPDAAPDRRSDAGRSARDTSRRRGPDPAVAGATTPPRRRRWWRDRDPNTPAEPRHSRDLTPPATSTDEGPAVPASDGGIGFVAAMAMLLGVLAVAAWRPAAVVAAD